MASESVSISEVIPAAPERIYTAWLSSAEHTKFTGDRARIAPSVGGKHSSFAGYAKGITVELSPGRRIVQTWRSTDFPPGSPDSRVEVTLEETVGGTMLTIFHSEIPPGQSDQYRDAWVQYYLEPLKGYFARTPKAKAKRKAKPARKTKAVVKRAKTPAKKKPAAKQKPKAKRGAGKKPAARKPRKR